MCWNRELIKKRRAGGRAQATSAEKGSEPGHWARGRNVREEAGSVGVRSDQSGEGARAQVGR